MHPDVGNRPATGHGEIIDPFTGMALCGGERKFRAREHGFADLSRGYSLHKPGSAVLETKYLGHAQQKISFSRSFHHAPALASVHGHGFLAQHSFATFDG